MELLVALMIVAVFAVWIYGLKQEICALQKRMPSENTAPAECAHAHPVIARNATPGSGALASHRDNVQTWVLE
jgi:hypothetical protein